MLWQRLAVVLLAYSLLAGARSASVSTVELTAENILAQVEKTYAACGTYRDSGSVITIFFSERGKRTVEQPFTTAFVRPDRFRYEFLDRRCEEEFDRYLVWREGDEVRTWWDVDPGVESKDSLEQALSGATGVSGGSARKIPGLLMPMRLPSWSLSDLGGLERIEDGEIGGARCYRISGTLRSTRDSAPVTLWIEQDSWLLRRIAEVTHGDAYRAEETTDYEPEIDVPIDASLLVFDPPADALGTPRGAPSDDAVLAGTYAGVGPEELLRTTAEKYSACASYRDSGVVTTIDLAPGNKCTVRMPFTTAFVRPDRLRFELRSRVGEEEFERYLAWRAGDEIRTWWGRPDAPRPPSLQSALDRAELTSGGSIHAIPSLLLPELRPAALSDLTDLQLLEDAWIGDVLCHRVTGTRRAGPLRSLCLWIDAESRLIRRIEQPGEFGDLRTRTTDYTPEIDIPIDSAALAFDPPEEAR